MSYLNFAIKLALANEYYPRWRFGAVVVRGGAVQAVGYNKLRNAPNQSLHPSISNCSIHAEQDVYTRVKTTANTILYLARVGALNEPRYAKPCLACREYLFSLNIKKVIFTVDLQTYGVWIP